MSKLQKYYTPAPEDFHMGMECFAYSGNTNQFDPRKIDLSNIAESIAASTIGDFMRVPYLTIDQIREMGFQGVTLGHYNEIQFMNYDPKMRWHDVRGQAEFTYTNDDRHILFVHVKSGQSGPDGPELKQVYAGRCRCKNDLQHTLDILRIRKNHLHIIPGNDIYGYPLGTITLSGHE